MTTGPDFRAQVEALRDELAKAPGPYAADKPWSNGYYFARAEVMAALTALLAEFPQPAEEGGFWDRLGVDDGLMPVHLPMGVDQDGRGPTDDSDAVRFVCWCGDADCPLTSALTLAAAVRLPQPATTVKLNDDERSTLLIPCECGHTINDHGSLISCWICWDEGDEEKVCTKSFEDLLVERIESVITSRIQARATTESEAQS